MNAKTKSIVLLLSLAAAIISGISVTGLIQSTERVSTSGIIVQPPPPTPPPVQPPPPSSPPPPEPILEINVYSDPECTETATNVIWGSIEVGHSVNRVLYVKNVGDTAVTLNLLTQNWNPSIAEDYIQLLWDYSGENVNPGNVLEVTLTLSIAADASGIDAFNFDIVLVGEPV